MDALIYIIIGVLIGIAVTACIVGKAFYDTLRDLKAETNKLKKTNKI